MRGKITKTFETDGFIWELIEYPNNSSELNRRSADGIYLNGHNAIANLTREEGEFYFDRYKKFYENRSNKSSMKGGEIQYGINR